MRFIHDIDNKNYSIPPPVDNNRSHGALSTHIITPNIDHDFTFDPEPDPCQVTNTVFRVHVRANGDDDCGSVELCGCH